MKKSKGLQKDYGEANPDLSSAIKVECDPQGIHINKKAISFPTTYSVLITLFGEATRIERIGQTKNEVYLWDDLGIYCASPDPNRMLMLLLVRDNRHGPGYQPATNFNGTVFMDGKVFGPPWEYPDAERPYMIRSVTKENKLVAIALGWNPRL